MIGNHQSTSYLPEDAFPLYSEQRMCFPCIVGKTEPGALCVLGECSTTDLNPRLVAGRTTLTVGKGFSNKNISTCETNFLGGHL